MDKDLSDSRIQNGRRFLDQIYERFPRRDPKAIGKRMEDLLQGLCRIRREMPQESWDTFCKEVVPGHKLTEIIRQDPFTSHSARKPRGYAGDASLLDYIYGYQDLQTTELGQCIYNYTVNTPTSRAVRTRARIIARIIDRLAEEKGELRIFSIACGHLREAEMSKAMQQGKISEYLAFDQDEESLSVVNERFGGNIVHTVQGSIGDLLMGKLKHLGQFDFVYAAGLYDYLSQRLATRLTSLMFNFTSPGGVTLLTNYMPDTVGTGFMEAFMEWNLIFRTPDELLGTASRIAESQITEKKSYVEDNQRVVFIELHKALNMQASVDTNYKPKESMTDQRRAQRIEEAFGH